MSCEEEDHNEWREKGWNVGLVTGYGTMVLDLDDKELARQFYRDHKELVSVIIETRRGAHFYFEGEGPSRKIEGGDVKGLGGYVVTVPSVVDGWTYRYVKGHGGSMILKSQPFPEELFPPARKNVVSKVIRDVRAYVAKIESVQGQSGSAGLVRAAARCRDAGVSASEATLILLEWNSSPVVQPPWPAEEIARAITRVYSQKGT
jgi:hypothetical protein